MKQAQAAKPTTTREIALRFEDEPGELDAFLESVIDATPRDFIQSKKRARADQERQRWIDEHGEQLTGPDGKAQPTRLAKNEGLLEEAQRKVQAASDELDAAYRALQREPGDLEKKKTIEDKLRVYQRAQRDLAAVREPNEVEAGYARTVLHMPAGVTVEALSKAVKKWNYRVDVAGHKGPLIRAFVQPSGQPPMVEYVAQFWMEAWASIKAAINKVLDVDRYEREIQKTLEAERIEAEQRRQRVSEAPLGDIPVF